MKKTICCLICLIVIVNFLSSCTSDTVDLDKDTLEWSYYNSPVEGYVKVECYEQSEHEYRIAYLDLGNDTCSVLGFSGNLPKVLSIPLTTSDGKAIIEISNRAFSLDPLENVHEIHFSDNIRKINKGAFNSPHNLKIIKFGNGLEYIDMNDFVNSPLEKIVFNENEFMLLCVRSSMGRKDICLANDVGIIDCDYYSNPDNDGNLGYNIALNIKF